MPSVQHGPSPCITVATCAGAPPCLHAATQTSFASFRCGSLVARGIWGGRGAEDGASDTPFRDLLDLKMTDPRALGQAAIRSVLPVISQVLE